MPLVNTNKVSVIVPIYNTEKYLNRCFDSILSSTYENLEVILVDDGSPDNSGKICDEYAAKDSRVRVIHKKNGGLSSARNAGLDVATGDYVTFVDSDDTIKIDAISRMIAVAEKENAAIVKMKFKNVTEEEETDASYPADNAPSYEEISNSEYLKAICTYRASCSFCDKLFRADVLYGRKFNEGRTNEDLLLLATILLETDYSIYELDYEGYYYLSRPNSITTTKFGRSVTDSVYNVIELEDLASKIRPELAVCFKELVLYQARTFILLMPMSYLKDKHRDYQVVRRAIIQNKQYIRKAFFSRKDKLFLKIFITFPKTSKQIASCMIK